MPVGRFDPPGCGHFAPISQRNADDVAPGGSRIFFIRLPLACADAASDRWMRLLHASDDRMCFGPAHEEAGLNLLREAWRPNYTAGLGKQGWS